MLPKVELDFHLFSPYIFYDKVIVQISSTLLLSFHWSNFLGKEGLKENEKQQKSNSPMHGSAVG